MPRSADDFLRDIASNPDDDGLKAVFADWLQDHGDPRGELMALQLKAAPTDEERSREALLLNRYLDQWLPPEVLINLDRTSIELEKGVFAAARFFVRSPSSLSAMTAWPGWGTARRLAQPPGAFASLHCPRIEHVTDLSDADVRLLVGHARRMPRLAVLGVFGTSADLLAPCFDSDVFATARELRLGSAHGAGLRLDDPRHLGWLFSSALGRRISRLVLHTGWLDLTPWLGRIDEARPELQLTPAPFGSASWFIRFEAGRRVVVHPGSDLNAAHSEGPVREILSTAPRGFFRALELPEHVGWNSVRALPCFAGTG